MSEAFSKDYNLARGVKGELALAINVDAVGEEGVEALTTYPFETVDGVPSLLPITRSFNGMLFGGDLVRGVGPAVRVGDFVYMPIMASAHTENGQRMMAYIDELREGHDDAQVIQSRGKSIPFGRVVHYAALSKLSGIELQEAVDQKIIAFGEYPYNGGYYEIVDDKLRVPIEPWALRPNKDLPDDPRDLLSLFQERGGRSAAFRYMSPVHLSEWDAAEEPLFVGSASFSAAGYIAQFTGLVIPQLMTEELFVSEEFWPQLPGPAWLDRHRSSGLHNGHSEGFKGRHIEAMKSPGTNLKTPRSLLGTLVEAEVFEGPGHSQIRDMIGEMSTADLVEVHKVGYPGNGV